MPNPDGIDPAALKYWGVIEGAVAQRLNTADIWSLINDQAEAAGLSRSGLRLQDFNTMRGMAAGLRNGGERLAAADPAFGIAENMIGTAPWHRTAAQQDALAMFQVRFAHSTIVDGEPQTDYRTVMLRGALPATVGDLYDLVDADAFEMADNYGAEHAGISDLSIIRI